MMRINFDDDDYYNYYDDCNDYNDYDHDDWWLL